MDLSIAHVVNVSLSFTPVGLSAFNVANLAIYTDEQPATPYANASTGNNGYGIYYSATAVGKDYGTASKTYAQAVAIFSQSPNILTGGGYLVIIPMMLSSGNTGTLTETLAAALLRGPGLVSHFAVLCNAAIAGSDWTAASNWVQGQNMILGRASYQAADLTPNTGALWTLQASGNSRTRGMYYGNLGTQNDANNALAAALSRGMGVDWNGSKTAMTLHMKQLAGFLADQSMTETLWTNAQTAGALVYPSIASRACLQDFNANGVFFDEIFSQSWLWGALQVAGFNAQAQTGTKIPQTDDGADVFAGAYRAVCQQAATAGYVGAGTWTAPDKFGNPDDFVRNIQEQGFYVYIPPVAQQSATARSARQAPVCQIAIKEAGAMHSSNVIVNINA